jgi:hypothetical protein
MAGGVADHYRIWFDISGYDTSACYDGTISDGYAGETLLRMRVALTKLCLRSLQPSLFLGFSENNRRNGFIERRGRGYEVAHATSMQLAGRIVPHNQK